MFTSQLMQLYLFLLHIHGRPLLPEHFRRLGERQVRVTGLDLLSPLNRKYHIPVAEYIKYFSQK